MTPPEPVPNLLSKLELNSHGCLSLAQLIEAFQTPITEEHAWALLYQSARSAQRILANESTRKECYMVTRSDELFVYRDGSIHADSFLMLIQNEGSFRRKCNKERKLISNLGVVIFLALDYGIPDNAERSISEDLESVLDSMVSGDLRYDASHEKESIRKCDFHSIVQASAQRLIGSRPSRSRQASVFITADSHYKAVCRAYVAEALELSTFLQKVAKCKSGLRCLESANQLSPSKLNFQLNSKGSMAELAKFDKLGFSDWARLWVQVIRELRQGVKFKRHASEEAYIQPPIECALSPYELLMDDIRSRRYTLKKVGIRPIREKIETDAHNIILNFIRSRPPLRKVNERMLEPTPIKSATSLEKLVDSIRLHQINNVEPKN